MDIGEESGWIEGYLGNLATQRKLSPHTIAAYRRDLKTLQAFVASDKRISGLSALAQAHVRRSAGQMHAAGLNPRSIARCLSAWRGFYDWLAEHIALAANPVDGVKAPKRAKTLPKALSADDAVQVAATPTPLMASDSSMGLCNRAMFELLYSSGLRVSELTALDFQYFGDKHHQSKAFLKLDESEVEVTGKGGRIRTVPVGGPALEALRAWLAIRPTLAEPGESALFLSERGTRMSPRVVQLRLKHHAQALGIQARVHPHVLRHSFASHVLQSSGDLRAVQEMLGHVSIAATQVYTSLDFQRLAEVYDATHPRAKKKD